MDRLLCKFGRYFVKTHREPNCCCLWCVNRNKFMYIHDEIKEFPLGRTSISIYCERTSLRLDQTFIWCWRVLRNDDRVDHVKNSTSQLTMNVQRLNKTGFRFRQSIFFEFDIVLEKKFWGQR